MKPSAASKLTYRPALIRIQLRMPDSTPPTAPSPNRSSRILVIAMLVLIVLSIAAFLILHPDPSGAGHTTTHTTSDH